MFTLDEAKDELLSFVEAVLRSRAVDPLDQYEPCYDELFEAIDVQS
jgi:hypothetical protein